jgi:AcrR family transcriptional regulator
VAQVVARPLHSDAILASRGRGLHAPVDQKRLPASLLERFIGDGLPPEIYLSFIDPQIASAGINIAFDHRATELFASCVGRWARHDPAVKQRLISLSDASLTPMRTRLLTAVYRELGSDVAMFAAANLLQNTISPIRGEHGLEALFLQRQPYDSSGSFVYVPRNANQAHAKLCRMVLHDPTRRSAASCPPSFYSAFGSKEHPFLEAIKLYTETVGARPMRALVDEPTARGGIEAMLRESAAVFSGHDTPRGCMIVLGAINCTPSGRGIQAHMSQYRVQTSAVIQGRLERGVAEGDVPAGLDLAPLSSFYTAVLMGLSIRAHDGATREELDRAIDCAMAAWDPFCSPVPQRAEPGTGAALAQHHVDRRAPAGIKSSLSSGRKRPARKS